ncbi:hypothetical protein T265_08814 [Opisthorchis viverrini]|uniref:Uncharacterized protein n=1 Tax=Opisthorchis viverrini TaxID=6198 RepID=A0A074ZIW4_OPIVI|nr:hypothetical protein T265_08814 [Opisthorchis viverrini]KER23280.1 hypothetical protein T265_08814 [Opisthorchis viverrini]
MLQSGPANSATEFHLSIDAKPNSTNNTYDSRASRSVVSPLHQTPIRAHNAKRSSWLGKTRLPTSLYARTIHYLLHECLRRNVLPPSTNHRPALDHPQAWALARQYGRRMVKLMIKDAHNRLKKYERELNGSKTNSLTKTSPQHLAELEAAIGRRVDNVKIKRRAAMEKKLGKLTRNNKHNNYDAWIKNLSGHQLSTAEQELLMKGLNFNKDYLAS